MIVEIKISVEFTAGNPMDVFVKQKEFSTEKEIETYCMEMMEKLESIYEVKFKIYAIANIKTLTINL